MPLRPSRTRRAGPLLTEARSADEVVPYAEANGVALQRFQRDYLGRLFRLSRGNITRAAKAAGIPRQTLHRLIRELGLKVE